MKSGLRLKECPFCGGEAYIGDNWEGSQYVKCVLCGCGTPPFRSKEMAIERWNHRYTLPESGRNPKKEEAKVADDG